MKSSMEALAALKEGNQRFVSGVRSLQTELSQLNRQALVDAQHPFAVIIGCSDSRVPVEIIFDQGVGDLFVIRVAGNIVAPSQIGSVEFAAEQFGTRLVVVLGHTHCGAVRATLNHLQHPEHHSENIGSIVRRISPAVEGILAVNPQLSDDALAQQAVRANVRMSAQTLRQGSEILEKLIQKDGMLVVGAEYSLDSGKVEFFDGLSISK